MRKTFLMVATAATMLATSFTACKSNSSVPQSKEVNGESRGEGPPARVYAGRGYGEGDRTLLRGQGVGVFHLRVRGTGLNDLPAIV